jgi:hypothetical protein
MPKTELANKPEFQMTPVLDFLKAVSRFDECGK